MAPSSGHILVPKVIKAFRFAINKTASFVRARVPQVGAAVETVPVRVASRHPIHPLAALRQSRSQQRYFSTALRRIAGLASNSAPAARTVFPTSTIRTALSKTTHAPFSSPLRPNLTGGAIPRSAGGYSLGGQGVRHFSHTPAANAQVINNVSAAVRAFCYNGFSARYDGKTDLGEKRYRAITVKQEKAFNKIRSVDALTARGTSLEFKIAPTVTALSPTKQDTLEDSTIITTLASDFSRNLNTLARVHEDLKRLSTLGHLPISSPNPHTISVRFPGCDGALVTALCDELSISRGIVVEDPSWAEDTGDKDVEMALLFPWAPSKAVSTVSENERYKFFGPTEAAVAMEWQSMLSPPHSPRASDLPASPDEKSLSGFSIIEDENPWREDESSYDGLRDSDLESNDALGVDLGLTRTQTNATIRPEEHWHDHTSYDGIEGICKFLAECDAAGRR